MLAIRPRYEGTLGQLQFSRSLVTGPALGSLVSVTTLGHIAAGVAYSLFGLDLWQASTVHLGVQAYQPALRRDLPQIFGQPAITGVWRTTADLGAMIGSYLLTKRVTKGKSGGGHSLAGLGILGGTLLVLKVAGK